MKTKSIIVLLFFVMSSIGFSQEIPTPLAEGIVVTTTNERIPFKMLRKEGAEIVFNNISTGSIFRYLPNTIKKIEDFEFNILYINPEFKNEPNINEKYIPRIAKLFKPDYPEGVYLTKEDFINKAASNQQIELGNDAGQYLDEYTLACETTHFYYKDTAEKIKNVFAISHNGFLYFQTKEILKNRSNSFKKNNFHKSYALVKNDAEINFVLNNH